MLSIQEYAYDTWRCADSEKRRLLIREKECWEEFNRLSNLLEMRLEKGLPAAGLDIEANVALRNAQKATEDVYNYRPI